MNGTRQECGLISLYISLGLPGHRPIQDRVSVRILFKLYCLSFQDLTNNVRCKEWNYHFISFYMVPIFPILVLQWFSEIHAPAHTNVWNQGASTQTILLSRINVNVPLEVFMYKSGQTKFYFIFKANEKMVIFPPLEKHIANFTTYIIHCFYAINFSSCLPGKKVDRQLFFISNGIR